MDPALIQPDSHLNSSSSTVPTGDKGKPVDGLNTDVDSNSGDSIKPSTSSPSIPAATTSCPSNGVTDQSKTSASASTTNFGNGKSIVSSTLKATTASTVIPAAEANGAVNDDHHDGDSADEDGANPASEDGVKRPRLRLAHACDRCRKRKIKCDTEHPCGPCQATKNECTFHTPSRRITKPKSGAAGAVGAGVNGENGNLSGGAAPGGGSGARAAGGSNSSAGHKRPHSPQRGSSQYQATLEARLATLEAMLRDTPPNVHNAFLSSLDARLGSGQGVGINQGKGDGVGVAVEALSGSGSSATNGMGAGIGNGAGGAANGINGPMLSTHSLSSAWSQGVLAQNGLKGDATLAPAWNTASNLSGIWAGGRSLKRRDDMNVSEVARRMENLSFFYEDEIGQAKWQGATSGFPLLELLTKTTESELNDSDDLTPSTNDTTGGPSSASPITRASGDNVTLSGHKKLLPGNSISNPSNPRRASSQSAISGRVSMGPKKRSNSTHSTDTKKERFFPDRTPRPHQTLNPEASWKVITGVIPPDLMDTLVRCYLSTSHLLWPFLHVPSFLADYANPQQWGEPGFACFIVAVCTLSSRHVDDPRVRANPSDPSTAGKQYFELFKRLRDLPSADRPTLYSIQAAFLAAIYAFGLGNLSKAFALQAESVTLCLDGGLHRSVDGYDHFDAIERETRKRTFWSIYSWDKQSAALFGRPPIIHLRDCDVTEPMIVDDENLTSDGPLEQLNPTTSRMCAFVAAIRLHVVLEGVIDSSVQPSSFPNSPFLARAAATIAKREPQHESLRDEESLLDEWTKILPKYWSYDSETANSRDPIRITQAERLHCLEHLVKMIIYRHRFSGFVVMPAHTAEERARHVEFCRRAMQCALTIIADHVHISQRGMMTYYGVHVIHQLAQAGRTLVAVVLNCKGPEFRPLISPSIEGLRSCVGLLRRFSGRYLCGLRSADIIDEFCRICKIPIDSPRVPDSAGRPSPAWLRPVRRRASPSPAPSALRNSFSVSPTDFAFGGEDIMSAQPDLVSGQVLGDIESVFNAADYFDMSALDALASPPLRTGTLPNTAMSNNTNNAASMTLGNNIFGLGEASAPYDRLETLTPNDNLGGSGGMMLDQYASTLGMVGVNGGVGVNGSINRDNTQLMDGTCIDMGTTSSSGDMMATDGVDNMLEGIGMGTSALGNGNGVGIGGGGMNGQTGNLSAATILNLLETGTFDYGSIFTDQAPLPDYDMGVEA